jgi:acetyltransferase-like isoleucine patch superfamily enzyme
MKLIDVLRRYSLRELIPFGLAIFVDAVDCILSTIRFRLLSRWHGVFVGRGSKVWGCVRFRRFPGSTIRIGRNLRAVCRPGRYAFNIFPQALIRTYSQSSRIEIGDDVGFNSIAIFCRSRKIIIGARTMIGGNCQIMDSDGHRLWPPAFRWFYPGNEDDAPVTIGEDVFIGLNVTILKGTSIGSGSVIAAGSIVAGTIPENCLAGGVPARVIRVFADETLAQHEGEGNE